MKILVFSDSHASISFMCKCVEWCEPDAIVHLGDYYRDGQTVAEEYPHIPTYQVPGNCDAHRGYIPDPEIRLMDLGGVRIYMTHGHRHGVKQTLCKLLHEARAVNAQLVLFGHTHSAVCQQENGLWTLNPGPATYGGSAGVVEIQNKRITACRLLYPEDLKDLLASGRNV